MIISVEKLKQVLPEVKDVADDVLEMQLTAIEEGIRAYTNNNFQNRAKRISAPSSESQLQGFCEFFKVGDTVQISESGINDGLYVIKAIDKEGNTITCDKELFDAEHNLVTKIEYPTAIIKGAVDMMKWEATMRDKVGVASETLSRHSVTYFAQDAGNQLMGYPVTLLGFLKPYTKARF